MAGVMAMNLTACGGGDTAQTDMKAGGNDAASTSETAKIGVSMPTQSLQRWNQDGTNMKEQLEKADYTRNGFTFRGRMICGKLTTAAWI